MLRITGTRIACALATSALLLISSDHHSGSAEPSREALLAAEAAPANTPFHGTPMEVPGKIPAEDFDNGGEGAAYHDTDSKNRGHKYRLNEGVDLDDSRTGTYAIIIIVKGEWAKY